MNRLISKQQALTGRAEAAQGCTYSHVGFAASIHGLGNRVHQVTADPEVAHLHVPLLVDQHVGRFHV